MWCGICVWRGPDDDMADQNDEMRSLKAEHQQLLQNALKNDHGRRKRREKEKSVEEAQQKMRNEIQRLKSEENQRLRNSCAEKCHVQNSNYGRPAELQCPPGTDPYREMLAET